MKKTMYQAYVEVTRRGQPSRAISEGIFDSESLAFNHARVIANIILQLDSTIDAQDIESINFGTITDEMNIIDNIEDILRDLGVDIDGELQDWVQDLDIATLENIMELGLDQGLNSSV
jgi:hypothetical protein